MVEKLFKRLAMMLGEAPRGAGAFALPDTERKVMQQPVRISPLARFRTVAFLVGCAALGGVARTDAASAAASTEGTAAGIGGHVYRRPVITVPLSTKPVTCDGILAPAEWTDAARMPVLLLGGTRKLAPVTAWMRVKYDAGRIYFGFESEHAGPLLRTKTKRDDALWEDSAFEVSLYAGGSATNHRAYVALNAANVIYDMLDGNKAWDGVRESGVSVQAGKGWTAEFAFPFASLGMTAPAPGTEWKLNVMHDWDQLRLGCASWAECSLSVGELHFEVLDFHGTLRFGANDTAVQINSLGSLSSGHLVPLVARNGTETANMGLWIFYGLYVDGERPKGTAGALCPNYVDNTFPVIAPPGRKSLLTIAVMDHDDRMVMDTNRLFFVYDLPVQPQDPLFVKVTCLPLQQRLDVELDLSNMDEATRKDIASGKNECRLALMPEGAGAPLVSQIVKPAVIRSTWPLPLPDVLPPGRYVVKTTLAVGAGYAVTNTLNVPANDFLTAKVEVNHDVPEPWVPIEATAKRVRVLNREYRLGRSPFPVEITSVGETVLAKPVDWVVVTARGEERIAWDVPRVVERHPDVVRLEGMGRLKKLGVTVTMAATVEFDGQWLTTVTFTPTAPVDIQGMYLEYRVPRACGEYVLAPLVRPWVDDQVQIDLFFGMDTPIGPQHPQGVRVTGLRAGLYLFTPTDGNWVYPQGKPNVAVTRGKDETAVRVRIIQSPVVLKKPAAYTFVMTATPVKPRPPRNTFMSQYESWQEFLAQTNWVQGTHDWFWQPGKWRDWISQVSLQPDVLRRGLEAKRKKGLRYFWQYTCASQLVAGNPYADYWGATWTHDGQPPPPVGNFKVCPNSSFRELFVQESAALARDFGVGPEFAMLNVEWCGSRVHGCGYTDSFGREARTSSTLGYRDELKRVYKACHRYGCLVSHHDHSIIVVPADSFYDRSIPGEQYTTFLRGKEETFYTQDIKISDYLVEMNPFLHGLTMLFLPEYARTADLMGGKYNVIEWQSLDELSWGPEHLLTMLLPHDIEFVNCNMPPRVGKRVSETMRRLGVYTVAGTNQPEAEFTGYWEKPPVTPGDPALLLSTYRVPGRPGLVAILSNPTLTNRIARLQIAPSAALPATVRVKDEYPGTAVLADETSSIPIPAQSFRILTLAPAP